MRRLAELTCLLMFVTATACAAKPSNLLIGQWKLDPASHPDPVCGQPITFTATTFTQPDPQGTLTTIPVTYVAGETATFPTVVYLITDAGAAYHTTFRFLSADRMVLDTPLQCTYVRA